MNLTTLGVPELALQFGMAGAVVVSVYMFLRFLGEERKARLADIALERQDRAAEREKAIDERTRFLDVLEKYRTHLDIVVERCTEKQRGL